ncbi:hypothetical protein RFI_10229 [Reticulomyxa filosa]|uniref:Transcription initiation factor IIA subunit 2 n=1 Tax=Reticulomyxa filosa TaxID=46433 RepID=X6NMK6_RETFI|nr:hypothetical protein RFI_10229 [Reticulomyxa filosa]|eukprot:ETO26909.1 hypothetical protein RFI_10229 [Reticulomyxa filosa]
MSRKRFHGETGTEQLFSQAKKNDTRTFKVYRRTTLGTCLYDAITELVNDEMFPENLALAAMEHYDRAVASLFQTQVRTVVTSWSGQLYVYRYHEDVWEFYLKNAVFKTAGNPTAEHLATKNVHIVACDGTAPGKNKKNNKKNN